MVTVRFVQGGRDPSQPRQPRPSLRKRILGENDDRGFGSLHRLVRIEATRRQSCRADKSRSPDSREPLGDDAPCGFPGRDFVIDREAKNVTCCGCDLPDLALHLGRR